MAEQIFQGIILLFAVSFHTKYGTHVRLKVYFYITTFKIEFKIGMKAIIRVPKFFFFAFQRFKYHRSVYNDEKPPSQNLVRIGSWGSEIWLHEYLISPSY